LALAHGGDVRLISPQGTGGEGGATFVVWFPVAPTSAA
jgi:signal transduction histidine kinase